MTENFQWLLMQGSISHLLKPIFLIYVTLFLCISHCWTGSDTAEVLRPRGVPLSKKVFYEPSRDFSCIDGSGTYPFHFVNDDFCDCADGSDEPGTAACPNGVFHCINAGYVSQDIPSSRVNDGICDCCDGSDEYNSSADCINLCMEFGRKAREEAQKRQELYEEGHSLWKEYALQGKQIKENNKAKIENLRKAEEEAEKIKTEKEAIKNEAEGREKAALAKYESEKDEKQKEEEEQEMMHHQEEEKIQAEEAFKELDKNQDGILTYDELQQFPKFDSNHDGVVSEEEAKFFLHMKNEMELEEFVTTGWMIMKPIYTMDKLTTPAPPVIHPPPEQVPLVTPPNEGEEEQEENYNLEDYDIPEDEPSDDEEEEEELETPPEFPPKEEAEVDNQTVDKKEEIQYDEETQKLIDEAKEARREHKEATDRLEKIRDEIRQVQADLETDFGTEDEFAVLKGQCFDFDDREYTYRLCPFDKASQIPKAGGSDINLGRWGFWAGPENNKYSKMKLENGQVCWNGPQRSVMVLFHCGLENKVFATSEPNRCEYLFEFNSPSLCSSLPTDIHRIHEHTEL